MVQQSGIEASEELTKCIAKALSPAEGKDSSAHLALVVSVSEDETQLVPQGTQLEGNTTQVLAEAVCKTTGQDEAYFVLVNYHDVEEILLITHIPDSCKVRKKMIYASTQARMKLAVGLDQIGRDIRTDSIDELQSEIASGLATMLEGDKSEAPLTEEETVLQRKNKSLHAAENASYIQGKPSDALEVDDEVVQRALQLQGDSSGEEGEEQNRAAVVSVVFGLNRDNNKRERLSVGEAVESTTNFEDACPKENTCKTWFLLVEKPKGKDNILLLLFCKDDASIKERMMFAFGTKTLQDTLRYSGVQFDSVQVSSLDEVRAAVEVTGDEGSQREASTFSRPKRPGRGKRGLARRPKE